MNALQKNEIVEKIKKLPLTMVLRYLADYIRGYSVENLTVIKVNVTAPPRTDSEGNYVYDLRIKVNVRPPVSEPESEPPALGVSVSDGVGVKDKVG